MNVLKIDLSSGDLTVDVAGDIILDAAGEEVIFKDGSTNRRSCQYGVVII